MQDLEVWRQVAKPFFFHSKSNIYIPRQISPILAQQAKSIMAGKITYFSAQTVDLGLDYDWLTNPETGFRYDINQHWTAINDFSETAGDIKYVWEKSRFSYILTVIRYDYHFQQDCAKWIFQEIDSWIASNPLNHGPNYKCSQEISLRVFHWIFCLYYYRDSEALTTNRFNRILNSIYGQIKHVYDNIEFSRIAVRNNHAITEALALYMVGLLFPFLPEAMKWHEKGKQWLEEEIAYQIYEDGTYLQFSHNYHRVTVQLLTWAMHLSRANNLSFSPVFYKKSSDTIKYLYQCQEEKTGHLPNYGANDGALFFQFSTSDYRDYRPQLQALYHALTGQDLYPEATGEDYLWYNQYTTSQPYPKAFRPERKSMACFPKGGIYIIRDTDETITFIKCASYKDRPSQADNLHLDIWYKGHNLLPDAGTYKYNTKESEVRYFFGTEGHNTVMLGQHDQMEKGPRFIWWNWTKWASASLIETATDFEFKGEITAFETAGRGIKHRRTIRKTKHEPTWMIEDLISESNGMTMRQIWHFKEVPGMAISLVSNGTSAQHQGWYAKKYGEKEQILQVEFISENHTISTELRLKQT
jgi:hypothetical protein